MKKDYQTKKGRLTKKPTYYNFFKAHFKFLNPEDVFGFNSNTLKLSLFEKFIGLIIAVWVIVFILQALKFIF